MVAVKKIHKRWLSSRAVLGLLDLVALIITFEVAQRPDGVAIACSALIVAPVLLICHRKLGKAKPAQPVSAQVPAPDVADAQLLRPASRHQAAAQDRKSWLRDAS